MAHRTNVFQDIALSYKENLEKNGQYNKPIATEISPFTKFWKAEDYHQDFVKLHPNHGYVQNISIPRLKEFQEKRPDLLK